ncbi:FecR family protein [Flagellimonas halotolerans]|uniref:FecR family protein n=1 Tax=Flagellimonas halotolerans TaxID=3112164 RepID=A0ABU6ISZ4_9FLAO|nr:MULTISPECIES: FecR family protein [unclassified Allomuricauda]MEC3966241.1 FecR family protein [Muricauda sp. SYSU M86414]MEC4266073.1 FecR family protein [Muricauda sp. SYSU M84420]
MTKLDIRRIITRYINQEASSEELAILYEWVQKGNNREVFKKLVQADFLVNYEDRPWQTEDAFEHFLDAIQKKAPKGARTLNLPEELWKYAAIITIMLGSSLFFLLTQTSPDPLSDGIQLDTDQITLQLDNGKVFTIDPGTDKSLQSHSGSSLKSLVKGGLTQEDEKSIGKSTKNTIRVPFGKTLTMTLEDGSRVMLNSGSSLIYPSSFEGLQNREVALSGEAFFEIAKNPDRPFIVNTKKMVARVYGTVFNVSAYEGDERNEVVLVEGSVGVGKPLQKGGGALQMLEPSQKASSLEETGQFTVEDVDVSPYISWTKGVLTFQNEAMNNIIKRLERQYNVKIDNTYSELDERRFTGMFDEETIDHVLRTIQAHTHFSYTKKDDLIIIEKP